MRVIQSQNFAELYKISLSRTKLCGSLQKFAAKFRRKTFPQNLAAKFCREISSQNFATKFRRKTQPQNFVAKFSRQILLRNFFTKLCRKISSQILAAKFRRKLFAMKLCAKLGGETLSLFKSELSLFNLDKWYSAWINVIQSV